MQHDAPDHPNAGPEDDSGDWTTASDASHDHNAPCTTARDRGCGDHGCTHYRRRCKLVSPCCGEVFWCRHCHNAAKDDGEQDPNKRHQLDRKQVQEVVCALCDTRQPVALDCRQCGVAFGRYACSKCNFYDDDTTKDQFHCDDCGICRVGGAANFFHCSTCNCCYAISLQQQHVCVHDSMKQNCPVCFEYLFDSVRPISVLPCGHTIHQECYQNLLSHDNMVCPICMKSCISMAQQERVWHALDEAVSTMPMPEEYRGMRVEVLCNDCSEHSTVNFHFYGHKCSACGGYNTRRA